MGSKLCAGEIRVLKYHRNFVKQPLVVGTENLFNLPSNFVVISMRALIIAALTAGGTFIIGEDGGGDADGYFTDLIAGQAAGVSQRGPGALLKSADYELEHVTEDAKDGVLATVVTNDIIAGEIEIYVLGYQMA